MLIVSNPKIINVPCGVSDFWEAIVRTLAEFKTKCAYLTVMICTRFRVKLNYKLPVTSKRILSFNWLWSFFKSDFVVVDIEMCRK